MKKGKDFTKNQINYYSNKDMFTMNTNIIDLIELLDWLFNGLNDDDTNEYQ